MDNFSLNYHLKCVADGVVKGYVQPSRDTIAQPYIVLKIGAVTVFPSLEQCLSIAHEATAAADAMAGNTLLRADTTPEVPCEDCNGTGNDLGVLSADEKTDCLERGGTGRIVAMVDETPLSLGDVIDYMDPEFHFERRATVMEVHNPKNPNSPGEGWVRIKHDGADDEPDIHTSLIRRVVPLAEYLEMAR